MPTVVPVSPPFAAFLLLAALACPALAADDPLAAARAHLAAGDPGSAAALLAPLAAAPEAGVEVLTLAGEASLALGRGERAASWLERAVAIDPRGRAARGLGLLRGRQGDTFAAYRHLRPWALAHPDDLEAGMAAALCAVELGRVPEAEQLLASLPPADPRVRLLRGKSLLLAGQAEEAVAQAAPAIAGAPPPLARDLRSVAAEAYVRIGRSADAVAVLDGHTGGDRWLTLLLGRAQAQGGASEQALATLGPLAAELAALDDAALEARGLAALAGQVFLEHGRLLLTGGDTAGAVPLLERASALRAGDRQVWQSLGQALVASGRRDEGLEALERFRALVEAEGSDLALKGGAEAAVADPTVQALQRADALYGQGQLEAALEVLRGEQQLVPEDLRPWLSEARLLLLAGRLQPATEAARALVERFAGEADAFYLLGVIHAAAERRPEAERALRRALALAPGHVAAMGDLAVLLTALGRRDEARDWLERLLALEPGDQRARERLERLSAGG